MRVSRFFVENINNLVIENEEFHHLKKVLRKEEGDKIEVLNGKGVKIIGYIKKIYSDYAEIEKEQLIEQEKPDFHLSVCIAFLPSDKLNFVVRKLTEIGVSSINIFPSLYSKINKIKGNIEKKHKKLRNVAISAIKQSGNLFLPEINILKKFNDIFDMEYDLKILLSQNGEYLIKSGMFVCDNKFSVCLTVGAEGGFSTEEIELFKKNNFMECKINTNTLRSETAAISGALLIKYLSEFQCF